ncbi:MAG: thiol oxidoreductase [Acidobacteria bacterium]|nr:MAG: thiol oxidoreductase [Acidobacteriota bacterium]
MKPFQGVAVLSLAICVLASTPSRSSQAKSGAVDPGVRGGPPGAGGPLPGLTADETVFFQDGQSRFGEIETVQGDSNDGLGPRFNSNQCLSCHSQPNGGGSSPAQNPLISVATLDGAKDTVPWFIAPNGPVRETRFKKSNGVPDGNVHALFVITGRQDAAGCNIRQFDFLPAGNPLTGQGGNANIIFRIPTPLFGTGLIEAIPDSAILANLQANATLKASLGISGHPSAIDETPSCIFTATPNNVLNFTTPATSATSNPAVISDIEGFANFMRMLAPPTPAPDTPTIANGRATFIKIGCAHCHTPSLTTGKMIASGSATVPSAALSNQTVHLFSDLLVHHMGKGLADGITQGAAGPDEFRTAPLWGVGQRIFFLHDGRTSNLVEAIRAHKSRGSEANRVIHQFNKVSTEEQQGIIDFLRAL